MGKSERIKNLYVRFKNFKAKHIDFRKFLKKYKCKGLLDSNKRFKNIHKGQRCFILGNGPSLKTLDFSLLSDEIVFTVNQIARNSGFEQLKPNYHFWADRAFFRTNDNPENKELQSIMIKVAESNKDLYCFFPVEEIDFVNRLSASNKLHSCFFATGLIMHEGFNDEIDYTRFVPNFGTVVQWCVTMAIYMGFKEIYLLGCDNTHILNTFQSALNENVTAYSYQITSNEQKRIESLLETESIYNYVLTYANTLKDYELLRRYCEKRGIKLINCTEKTLIDSVPKMKLMDVINPKV